MFRGQTAPNRYKPVLWLRELRPAHAVRGGEKSFVRGRNPAETELTSIRWGLGFWFEFFVGFVLFCFFNYWVRSIWLFM